jgi:hypothetical protein
MKERKKKKENNKNTIKRVDGQKQKRIKALRLFNSLFLRCAGFECEHFYGTQGPCSLVFNAEGMYALFPNGSCCFDLPGIGAPPRDWLANATFLGTETRHGLTANHWISQTHE